MDKETYHVVVRVLATHDEHVEVVAEDQTGAAHAAEQISIERCAKMYGDQLGSVSAAAVSCDGGGCVTSNTPDLVAMARDAKRRQEPQTGAKGGP